MARFHCGTCGHAAPSLDACPSCQGPVFDLSTPAGVREARAYRSLRQEGQLAAPTGYLAILAPVLCLPLFVLLGIADSERYGTRLGVSVGVAYLGVMIVRWWLQRRRPVALQALEARLARPDPFHDDLPEPPRTRPPTIEISPGP